MAPHGETMVSAVKTMSKPRRLSSDGLKRTSSEISFQLFMAQAKNDEETALPAIQEVEDAKCECCGMIEEYTLEYVGKVREKFGGKWICGLCSEAVKEESEKNGGKKPEAALEAHMNACFRFNKFGRAYPVLSQAQAMREMFKKSVSLDGRGKSGQMVKKGQIARSTSCIPALTREIHEFKLDSK